MLLSGIVGSTAYGLATTGSDIDRLGVFAAPTAELHGLHPPQQSIVTTAPDRTIHEVGKWCSLALACNPTVTELVWLPEELYEVGSPLGDELIELRRAFLSARRVRDAYLGYATQQFNRLAARGDGSFSADTRRRTAKHARHLARLVHQGRDLYATGELTVRLADPQWFHDFGEKVAAGNLDVAREMLAAVEADFARIHTPLPDRPDEPAVERWLRKVRSAHYERPPTGEVFLVDIDGTVALMDDRSPFEWHRVGEDAPNVPVVSVVRALAAAGHRIIYMSGRSEECRAATGVWIAQHIGVPGEALYMRRARDNRPDEVVKRELYERWVAPVHEVTAVLDDRAKVVAMWRALGLTVLQVAEGDF
ncbi:phosphatase domain-containing protein [Actinomadura craniellae]